jgi:Bifunctional DNA primase/polymerase, N-terminal
MISSEPIIPLTVATPSGGLHLYFTVPATMVVPSVAGIWPGDTRGPGMRLGGYLAGPGSVVGDRRYEIARDDPIAELPGWLAALVARPASGW